MDKQGLSVVEIENLIEILDSDGIQSLLKMIDKKVNKIGESILKEDLGKTSFAQLGTTLAKYQGAQELQTYIERELKRFHKQALQNQ